MVALSTQPLLAYTIIAALLDQGDGTVVASFLDGTVLSVQPDGSFQHRPEGTNGPWESAKRTPNGLVYTSGGERAYLVPYLVV
jgi:hypothetical protein